MRYVNRDVRSGCTPEGVSASPRTKGPVVFGSLLGQSSNRSNVRPVFTGISTSSLPANLGERLS